MIELDVAPTSNQQLSPAETLRAKIKSGKWVDFKQVIPDAQDKVDWENAEMYLDKSPNEHVLDNCRIFIKDVLEGTIVEADYSIAQLFIRQLARTAMSNLMPIPHDRAVLQEVLTQFLGAEEFEVAIEYQGA